jgi:hypothetical protein
MSALRVDGVKSGGRKPALVSSRALVVQNAFSFSAAAGLVFWICAMGLAAVEASGLWICIRVVNVKSVFALAKTYQNSMGIT